VYHEHEEFGDMVATVLHGARIQTFREGLEGILTFWRSMEYGYTRQDQDTLPVDKIVVVKTQYFPMSSKYCHFIVCIP
jgi:hypothetical protein